MISTVLKKIVVFKILMENRGGVLEKSPGYILEKWDDTMDAENCECLLDSDNLKKLNNYIKKWIQDELWMERDVKDFPRAEPSVGIAYNE